VKEPVSLIREARPKTFDVLILSSSPVLALGIQHALWGRPDLITFRLADPANLPTGPPTLVPDILVVAPLNWQDLCAWLPILCRHFSSSQWVVVTDLRIAGLFLSVLERQPCKLIPASVSVDILRAATLMSHVTGACQPTAQLFELLARNVVTLRSVGQTRLPSVVQFQCACGAAMGMRNAQIAAVLHLSETSVKTYLYRAGQILGRGGRPQLCKLVNQALLRAGPDKSA
jgi:DNA-binding NarL/FixJ family response regulator